MRSIFNTLLSAIRVKLARVFLVLGKLLNPQYLLLTVQQSLGTLFRKLLDVKPRDKKDYYTVFGWMISKKLAYSLVIIVGVLCAYYIMMMSPMKLSFGHGANNNLPTYSYNSWGLKNFTGQANIRAKGHYIAYEGDINKGVVIGVGKLMNKDGDVVYEGDFAGDMFNGKGQLKYPGGSPHYIGDFVNNMFQGVGKLYRENSVLQYDGQFANGLMHGDGALYDETGSLIFTGKFDHGIVSFPTLLHKTTADIATQYTGENIIYNYEENYAVYMSQIGAMSIVDIGADSIMDTQTVEGIIIFDDALEAEGHSYRTLEELNQYFDKKIYEGSTNIQFGEVAAFLSMNDKERGAFLDKSAVDIESTLKEVYTITGFDPLTELYIRTYIGNGLAYTFYYADKNAPFVMYKMETAKSNQ